MPRRLAVLGATATASLSLGLAVAVPASASKYPTPVKQEYLKACKKAARSGGVSSRDAKVYCEVSLKCLQRNLTLKQFEAFDRAIRRGDKTPPHTKVVNRCIRQAARAV